MGPRACKLVMGLVVGLTLLTAVGCKGCGRDPEVEGTPDAGECHDCGGPDGGSGTPDAGGVRRDSAVMAHARGRSPTVAGSSRASKQVWSPVWQAEPT